MACNIWSALMGFLNPYFGIPGILLGVAFCPPLNIEVAGRLKTSSPRSHRPPANRNKGKKSMPLQFSYNHGDGGCLQGGMDGCRALLGLVLALWRLSVLVCEHFSRVRARHSDRVPPTSRPVPTILYCGSRVVGEPVHHYPEVHGNHAVIMSRK